MALANIYRCVQDLEGNVVTGVLGTVTLSGTSTLASLFADAEGTLPLPNPTTNNAQYGTFSLFVGAGTYTMQFVKAGYTFEAQYNITLRDPAAGVTTITGTANRVIVAPVPGVGAVTLSTPQDIAPDSTLQFAHLGLGMPGNAGYALDVTGHTRMAGNLNVDVNTLVVDATANCVGILASVPDANLHVVGSSHFTGAMGLGAPPAVGTHILLTGSGSVFLNSDVGVGTGPNPLYALTVGGKNMLIQSGRSLGIGIDPAYQLQVATNAGIPGGVWVNSTSLAGLKRDIEPLRGVLGVLRALQPRRWRWSLDRPDLEALMPGIQAGFIVEEVAQGKPEWTPTDADGHAGLAMRGLEAYLVAAIQQLLSRLEALEAHAVGA